VAVRALLRSRTIAACIQKSSSQTKKLIWPIWPEGMPRELIALTRMQESTRDIPAEIMKLLETLGTSYFSYDSACRVYSNLRPRGEAPRSPSEKPRRKRING
jgi:hypothetical protein